MTDRAKIDEAFGAATGPPTAETWGTSPQAQAAMRAAEAQFGPALP